MRIAIISLIGLIIILMVNNFDFRENVTNLRRIRVSNPFLTLTRGLPEREGEVLRDKMVDEGVAELFDDFKEVLLPRGLPHSPEEYLQAWEETGLEVWYLSYLGASIEKMVREGVAKETVIAFIREKFREGVEILREARSPFIQQDLSHSLLKFANNPEEVYQIYQEFVTKEPQEEPDPGVSEETRKIIRIYVVLGEILNLRYPFSLSEGHSQYMKIEKAGKEFNVIIGEPFSRSSAEKLRDLFVSTIGQEDDWVFLVEGGEDANTPSTDYAYQMAKELGIAIVNPTVDIGSSSVISWAITEGLNEEGERAVDELIELGLVDNREEAVYLALFSVLSHTGVTQEQLIETIAEHSGVSEEFLSTFYREVNSKLLALDAQSLEEAKLAVRIVFGGIANIALDQSYSIMDYAINEAFVQKKKFAIYLTPFQLLTFTSVLNNLPE